MKKITFLKPALFTSMLISVAFAQAQNNDAIASLNLPKNKIIENGNITSDAAPKGTPRATFHAAFPDATEVSWFSYAKGLACVAFNTTGKMNRVFFDRKGRIAYLLSYYSKEMLPLSVLNTINQNYGNTSVFGVTEIRCEHKIAYIVALEDKTSWTDLTIIDNKIEGTEVWRKAQL
jgi:hypothetical protein